MDGRLLALGAIGASLLLRRRSGSRQEYGPVFLSPPGAIGFIGPEAGRVKRSGLSRLVSPFGSYRYLWSVDGAPVAALQVVWRAGETARVANVYTRPEHRSRGYATRLFRQAEKDFGVVVHAEDESRSPDAERWIQTLGSTARISKAKTIAERVTAQFTDGQRFVYKDANGDSVYLEDAVNSYPHDTYRTDTSSFDHILVYEDGSALYVGSYWDIAFLRDDGDYDVSGEVISLA